VASISITNVSVNYTGDAFQGKVDFDLNCTPTEARLNVGFRINLAAQLNFDAIDYGSNEVAEWCKKRLSTHNERELCDLFSEVAGLVKQNYGENDLSSDCWQYLQTNQRYFIKFDELDELLEKVTPVIFYKTMVSSWNLTYHGKAQLLNMIVAYPEQQTSSSHSVEFSVPKESLLNWNWGLVEEIEREMRDEFLALAGHQLAVWLSAELDWGNANTQGQVRIQVG